MSTPGDGAIESATEMAAALRAGEVTSVALVERALARAGRWQPSTNALSQLWADDALEASRRIDDTPGGSRPPFAGVPLVVKDVYDVAGRETTGCCAAYRGTVAASDAPTIRRMRAAGLVLLGKTNQHEISAGATNLVSACGATRNPWDPSRMTGGSSGGSGAAVAAGIVPWALGSDTGGSVRIPAGMCGGFALKPTTGRIPIDGMLPHSPSLDCPGPMTATAADLWLLFLVLDGRDPQMPLRLPVAREVRIGVPEGFFRMHVREHVAAVVEHAAEVFVGSGARVEPVDGGGIEDARRTWSRVAYPELAEAHGNLLDRRDLVDPSIVPLLEYGRELDPEVRTDALRRQREIAAWFRERLQGFDALLVPTAVYAAPRADAYRVDVGPGGSVPEDSVGPGWLTCPVNLSGLPAVNLPAGRSIEGMPVGVSLIGSDDADEALCGLAALWERAAGYEARRPPAP